VQNIDCYYEPAWEQRYIRRVLELLAPSSLPTPTTCCTGLADTAEGAAVKAKMELEGKKIERA